MPNLNQMSDADRKTALDNLVNQSLNYLREQTGGRNLHEAFSIGKNDIPILLVNNYPHHCSYVVSDLHVVVVKRHLDVSIHDLKDSLVVGTVGLRDSVYKKYDITMALASSTRAMRAGGVPIQHLTVG